MKIPPFEQSSLHTWKRRVGALVRRHFYNRFVPNPRVNLVTLNGHRFKRVTFGDAWRPSVIAGLLDRSESFRIFPAEVARFENELMVSFVDGRLLETFDRATIPPLAQFFAALYSLEPRSVPQETAGFGRALRRDLGFLRDAGVLEPRIHDGLTQHLDDVTPADVWVGPEYIDALPKNFVLAPEGHLVGIDVDAIHPDELLGIGVAKALLRAPCELRALFWEEFAKRSDLKIEPVMPFIELAFLASWTKICFMKGRNRLVAPKLFAEALEGLESAGPDEV